MREFFWQPVRSAFRAPGPTPLVKQFGAQLFELWGRCYLCNWSGPSPLFSEIQRDNEIEMVCSGTSCGRSSKVWIDLFADGWQPLHVDASSVPRSERRCTCDEGRGCVQHVEPRSF